MADYKVLTGRMASAFTKNRSPYGSTEVLRCVLHGGIDPLARKNHQKRVTGADGFC